MSLTAIRAALEGHLALMSPALATQTENAHFEPPGADTPYQQAWLLPAQPDNPEQGSGYYREQGIFKVRLCYPFRDGPEDAEERAEALREHFHRGLSLSSGGTVVTIDLTPTINPPVIEPDRYVRPVDIPWFAQVFR